VEKKKKTHTTQKKKKTRTPLQGTRKALLIGINYLKSARGRLRGCINDVKKMQQFLKRYHYQDSDMLVGVCVVERSFVEFC
jgi:Caspase domain